MVVKVKSKQTIINEPMAAMVISKQPSSGRECLRRPRHRLMNDFAIASRDQTLQLSYGECCT